MLTYKNLTKVFLIILFFVTSCSNKIIEVVEKKYSDGFPEITNYYKIIEGDSILIEQTAYYPNHNKKFEGKFHNKKRNGKWTYWFENGNKWSEGYIKDGINHGKRTIWYETGGKHYDAIYNNGERAGEWIFYDINGNTLKKINYDKKN